jgi:hypothetical protein
MLKNTEISVLVSLANQLGEVGRTEGPSSPRFGQILVNLNREYEHISPVRSSAPRASSQANGSPSGDIVVFPKKPSDPHKP